MRYNETVEFEGIEAEVTVENGAVLDVTIDLVFRVEGLHTGSTWDNWGGCPGETPDVDLESARVNRRDVPVATVIPLLGGERGLAEWCSRAWEQAQENRANDFCDDTPDYDWE